MADDKISDFPSLGARERALAVPVVGGDPFGNYKQTAEDYLGLYLNFTAGPRALVNAPTLTLDNLGMVYLVVNGGVLYPYSLEAGTDATSVPMVIRPADFHAITNAKVFKLAGPPGAVVGRPVGDYNLVPQVVVYKKSLTLLTSGSPADLGTITLPPTLTRSRVSEVTVVAETASGTLVAANLAVYDQAAGAGTSFVSGALTGLTGAGLLKVLASASSAPVNVTTLYVRQTVDSGNAGTVSIYVTLTPLP